MGDQYDEMAEKFRQETLQRHDALCWPGTVYLADFARAAAAQAAAESRRQTWLEAKAIVEEYYHDVGPGTESRIPAALEAKAAEAPEPSAGRPMEAELAALRLVHLEARELVGEADATGTIPQANLNALRALLWRASLKKNRT